LNSSYGFEWLVLVPRELQELLCIGERDVIPLAYVLGDFLRCRVRQVTVKDDVVRRNAVREARIDIELNDFSGRVSGLGMLDIGEGPAVAHQHQVFEAGPAKAQELSRPVTQEPLLLLGRIPDLGLRHPGCLAHGTHRDQQAVIWCRVHEFMRVHITPVALPAGCVSIVEEVVPRIHIVLGVGIEKLHLRGALFAYALTSAS